MANNLGSLLDISSLNDLDRHPHDAPVDEDLAHWMRNNKANSILVYVSRDGPTGPEHVCVESGTLD